MVSSKGRVLLVVLLASTQASAQDHDLDNRAKAYFQEGSILLRDGRKREALEKYQKAYELVPRGKILVNIASLYLDLGRKVEAANAFAAYLSGNDQERAKAPNGHEPVYVSFIPGRTSATRRS